MKVLTYGYHGRPLAELVRLAEAHDAVVIDARYMPRSRDAQWNRGPMERALGGRYRWVKPFGNMLYQTQRIQLSDPEEGLRVVAPILARQPIIVVCMCVTAETCHRAVVAAFIAERTGAEVVHLRPGGAIAAGPEAQLGFWSNSGAMNDGNDGEGHLNQQG